MLLKGTRVPQTRLTTLTCTLAAGQLATKRTAPLGLVMLTCVLLVTVPTPERIAALTGL